MCSVKTGQFLNVMDDANWHTFGKDDNEHLHWTKVSRNVFQCSYGGMCVAEPHIVSIIVCTIPNEQILHFIQQVNKYLSL